MTLRRRYRKRLARGRLFDIIVATCPVSYYVSFNGDGAALRRRLAG